MRGLFAGSAMCAVLGWAGSVGAATCYETAIRLPMPFNGNGGETIVLMDGSIWQDHSYQYLYLYEYNPTAIICATTGKLYVGEHVFDVTYVGRTGGSSGSAAIVIESQIDGEFEGWEGETIVRLMNGQIWEQVEYYYHYHYAYMPRVTIIKKGSRYYMRVEGIDKEVGVNRIK